MKKREDFGLTKRQIEIMRLLAEGGPLSMEMLKARDDTMQDLWLRDPRLADGWFRRTGRTRDDRFWEITEAGRNVLAQLDDARQS